MSVSNSQRTIYNVSRLLHKAKCLLILRRFGEAVQVCCEALDDIHVKLPLYRKSDQWTPGKRFVIIAIQAYAEQNQCQKAVTFANQVFGYPEMFPAEVLELCICLLLKGSKLDEASELAETWLNCKENFALEVNYLKITECYVKQILFPQGLFDRIQQFLETNQVITPEQREVLINYSRPLRKGKMESSASSYTKSSSEGADPCRLAHDSLHGGATMRLIAAFKKLQSMYTTVSCHQKAKTFIRILILLFFIYSFLTASGYRGVNKNSGIFVLWQAVLYAWRALFSPDHLMQ